MTLSRDILNKPTVDHNRRFPAEQAGVGPEKAGCKVDPTLPQGTSMYERTKMEPIRIEILSSLERCSAEADDMVANPLSRAYGKRPLSAEPRKFPSTPKVEASPASHEFSERVSSGKSKVFL